MTKRLTKSNDKKICGICGGLGEYFDIDPTIIRIAAAISVVCYGFGILAYIIAAFIIPNKED